MATSDDSTGGAAARSESSPARARTGDVTELLIAASGGNTVALDRVLPLVYDELRAMARGRLRGERSDHTLNPTALVHEAYVRLVDQTRVEWQNRNHFYAVASQAMRRVLLNYAEMRNAAKRGGGAVHVPIDLAGVGAPMRDLEELLALNDALERLQAFNPRGAEVVTYRFFAGLTHEEIAEVMGTSEVTVRRAWRAARAWLRRDLQADTRVEAIPPTHP